MCVRTSIEFGISKGYSKDESSLTPSDREKSAARLNFLGEKAKDDNVKHLLYRTKGLVFPETIDRKDSSLYMYSVSDNLCIILAYDDDPIFDRKIITLYRIVKKQDSRKAFNTTASLLYGTTGC